MRHNFIVVGLHLFLDKSAVRSLVAGGDTVLRSPLEHRQVLGLLSDHRDGLHTAGARADYRDPLSGELDPLVGPVSSVAPLSPEGVQALNVGNIACRDAADTRDKESGGDTVAPVCFHLPSVGVLQEPCGSYPGVEPDVWAKLKPVRHVVEVG